MNVIFLQLLGANFVPFNWEARVEYRPCRHAVRANQNVNEKCQQRERESHSPDGVKWYIQRVDKPGWVIGELYLAI